MYRKFTVVCIVGLALTALLVNNASGTEDDPTYSYSFDLDGDRIDDMISGEGKFEVIIHFKDGTNIDEGIAGLSGVVSHEFPMIDAVSAVVPDIASLEKIASMEEVDVIESQRFASFAMDTSVPAVKASPSEVYASRSAHDLGFMGDGVTIAVIDSGVDNEHPMLEGSFVAGADFTVPSMNRDGSRDPDDRLGHGTAIASIAMGREVDSVVGVAPGAGLIDLKVANGLNIDVNPITDELLLSLEWCIQNVDTSWDDTYEGVDVILISLAIGPSDGAVAQSIDLASDSGIIVVQAGGNSGTPYEDQDQTTWPDNSIIVGGIDHQGTIDRSDDEFWSLSTSGPRTDDGDDNTIEELKPDVVAPAAAISFAAFSRTSTVQPATGMSQGTGTSYAAPHVAGTVALMLDANPDLVPEEGNNPVMKIIHRSSETRGDPTFPSLSSTYNANYGWGILDSYQAVLSARSYTDTNHRPEISSFVAEPDVTTTGSVVNLRVIASDIDEDPLEYDLEADEGVVTGDGPEWEWTAPDDPGNYTFLVTVTDPYGLSDQLRTSVEVREGSPNRPPVITSFNADDRTLSTGGSTRISVVAFDQDEDPLEYDYDAILGTITGSGDQVTYNAPSVPGTDTVSVRVSDPEGASDQRELTISITKDSSNAPPSIRFLHLDPPVYNISMIGRDVILTAEVEDPDGLNDISLVIADLSSLGGSTGRSMLDDGNYPDNSSGDGVFSLIVVLPEPPMNGLYTITVTVVDSSNEESTDSIDLQIDIKSSGEVTGGRSSSTDSNMIVIVLVILFIIVVAGVLIILRRSRRKRAPVVKYQGDPNLAKVRYRQSIQTAPQQTIQAGPPVQAPPQQTIQAGPPAQAPPKFNVVSDR